MSGAADTVMAGASVLKNSIGIYGMIVVLSAFAFPLLKTGFHMTLLRFLGAICATFDKRFGNLMSCMAEMAGFMMALMGSCLFMTMLSCFCMMNTVSS